MANYFGHESWDAYMAAKARQRAQIAALIAAGTTPNEVAAMLNISAARVRLVASEERDKPARSKSHGGAK
jgi:hypothetical protein